MALRRCHKLNTTGTREQEVCGLRWDWYVPIPEHKTGIFLIPGERVKNREERVVVLNRVAQSVVESQRGVHDDYVFTYRGNPIKKMNSTSWKRVRRLVGLSGVRIHDLKHTYGRRLRAAGVPLETRKVFAWTSQWRHHVALLNAGVGGTHRGIKPRL